MIVRLKMPLSASHGVTIIELITAMTVTSFLAASIFIAYTNLYQIFQRQTRQAERIREAVVVKAKMDYAFKRVGFIEEVHPSEIRFQRETEDSIHTISWRDSCVLLDQTILARRIASLTFAISAEGTGNGRHALLWDAVIAGGRWIGGAHIATVRAESQ
jgi:Tfp pilus assembly protein PilW